jgi:hypothetical protein
MESTNDPEKKERVPFSGAKCLFVFSSVHQVMKAEKILKGRGYRVDLIPMPREISSDCGVAVELPFELHEEALVFLKESRLPILVSYAKRHGRYEKVEQEPFIHSTGH